MTVAVRVLPETVAVCDPGVAVTTYPVSALLPVLEGAVQDTTAERVPAVAETFVGAPGAGLPGVTAADAVEAGPLPTEFVATTVNVYDVPLVSPVTVATVPVVVAVTLPGLDVTVYCVIGAPLLAGAVHVTFALPYPAVAVTVVGAFGTPFGVNDADAPSAPVPTAFVALTVA